MLTDKIIQALAKDLKPHAFLLWGGHAQNKAVGIEAFNEDGRHLILKANHPSPLSALRPPLPFMGFEQSLKAISLRLSEGKERPSEALPIRRQLLEAKAASYRRLHAAHLLSAEVQALTNGVNP
mgnify:CR=1 FL=1